MNDLSWQWALCFIGIAYVVISVAVMAFSGWRKKRSQRLPPPQRQVSRDVYKEHVHTVGNMRGVR